MNTEELTGAALDWAVAQCEGHQVRVSNRRVFFDKRGGRVFTPSTNWSQGGPILEREEITIHRWKCEEHRDPLIRWRAELPYIGIYAKGPTPLIAAMRCYVASKLGDEVDIPEEICP